MNKKADLRDNTLSIIIAVIGLILLFIASWQIYSNVSENTAIKKAQLIADKMEAKINALSSNQNTDISLIGNKEPWFLTGWDTTMPDRPDKCSFEACVCVCPTFTPDSCQENGICRKFADIENISIVGSTFLQEKIIESDRGPILTRVPIVYPPYIPLPNALTKVYIIKTNKELNITTIKP